jgi:hypothetical protein
MAIWNCGAASCPGHGESSHRCARGTWRCGRVTPPCAGHAAAADRCASGTAWNCGARSCPTHGSASHQCASGVWSCGRRSPPCGGHSARDHQCRNDLTQASVDCNASFSATTPPGNPVQGCPAAGQIRLAELVEVVEHGGTQTQRPVAGRNQFINLDDRVDPGTAHPEYGRLIRLKARVEWASGDPSRSLAGQNVYWYAQAGGSNKAGLTGTLKEGFSSAGSGLLRHPTTTDAQGWTGVVSFYLSGYGGDSFSVHATVDASYAGGRQAGPYVVWKKFWYQVVEMQDGSGSVFNIPAAVTTAFETGYRTVFIEWSEQTPRVQASYTANLPASADRAAAARPHFRNDNLCPFKAIITTCDYSGTGNQRTTLNSTLRAPTWDSGPMLLWRLSGAGGWKVSAEYRPANPPLWRCQRVSSACPGHTSPDHRCSQGPGNTWRCTARGCPTHSDPAHVCSGRPFVCHRTSPPCVTHSSASNHCPSAAGATWSCGASTCPGHAGAADRCGTTQPWRNIPDSAISLAGSYSPQGFKHIHVDFTGGPVTPSASNPVDIRLVVLQTGPNIALGWGGGSSALFLCTGALHDIDVPANWNPIQQSDIVHELGHALGLVNMQPTAASAHDAWADTVSTPPQPLHCRKPPTQCAMWWQSSTTRLTTFHLDGGVGCHDHLRRQDFSRSVMASHWTPP